MEYKYFFQKHIGRCVVISLEDYRYIKGWIKTADDRYVTLNMEKYIVWGINFWRGGPLGFLMMLLKDVYWLKGNRL